MIPFSICFPIGKKLIFRTYLLDKADGMKGPTPAGGEGRLTSTGVPVRSTPACRKRDPGSEAEDPDRDYETKKSVDKVDRFFCLVVRVRRFDLATGMGGTLSVGGR